MQHSSIFKCKACKVSLLYVFVSEEMVLPNDQKKLLQCMYIFTKFV